MQPKLKTFHLTCPLMRYPLIILIFILILAAIPYATHAQIVIKEKVEIKPQAYLPTKPLAQHTIRIDMQWTPTNIPGAILNYEESGNYPCRNVGGTGFQTGGNLTYQIVDVVGGYNSFQFRFNNPCDYTNTVNGQYSIYYDETLVRTEVFSVVGCYSGNAYPFYSVSYNSPLITDYSLSLNSEDMCYNVGEDINLGLGHGCTNVEIDTSSTSGDMVNLQIISGGEYTSFYYQGTTSDNMSVPYSEVSSVRLKQDQFYSGSESTVVVESNISGITKQSTIRVHPKSSYGIAVDYVDYPIKYDETKYVEIEPYGPCGYNTQLPQEITLRAEIIKGSELGYLEDFDNGGMGNTLTNIPFQSFGGNHIGFVGSGVKPENIDTAIIRFSTTDAELNTVEVPVIITPGPLVVEVEPDTLLPGETATITIRNRLEDGTIIDFPSEQHFEISMIDGCMLGEIRVGSDSGNYFYDVPQPMIFMADANAEVGVVKLRVGLIEEIGIGRNVKGNNEDFVRAEKKDEGKDFAKADRKEGGQKRKDFEDKIKKLISEKRNSQPPATPENPESACYFGEYQTYTEEKVDFQVGKEKEILLGETKYYQAKYNAAKSKLKIEEIQLDANGVPQQKTGTENGWEWLTTDVWGDNPVSVVQGDTLAKRISVYYDKFYAKLYKSKKLFPNNSTEWDKRPDKLNLPTGMIRLIGRYWMADSTCKVNLKAFYQTDTTSIEIEIKKPSSLGDDQHTVMGPLNEGPYNLDSLIIYHAGKEGIFPQIIKAIIKNESVQFNPSYRYEPFDDFNENKVRRDFDSTHIYWIQSTSNLGNPIIPPHTNVWDASYNLTTYPGYVTAWDYYLDHKSFYKRTIYNSQNNKWIEFKNIHRDLLIAKGLDSLIAIDSAKIYADTSYLFYLKYEIGGLGMSEQIAQTRIAASYGLMQLTYYNGVQTFKRYPHWGYDYPNNDPNFLPESINLPLIGLKFGILHLKGKIRFALKSILFNENSWFTGYESSYWEGLRLYNGASHYPNEVFGYVKDYLPRK